LAEQRGSKYQKDGLWWVKFPLPLGQTWSDPSKPGKLYTKIEVSVRWWYRAQGVNGRGGEGEHWAKRLLSELNAQYYSGEPLTAVNHRTTIRDLIENLISTYGEKGLPSETGAKQKLRIFERHHIDETVAAHVTTDSMRVYRQRRMLVDGVSSATVNRDFALLRRSFRLGMRHTPPLVTAIPYFPFGEDCKRREGYLTLDLYERLIRRAADDVRPFYVAGCHLGVRVGALLQLRWSWIELWNEPVNDVHGIIRIPGRFIKNRDGLTTVIFGDFGVEIRRLSRIRDRYFPQQDLVFVRWGQRVVRSGPIIRTAEEHRGEYLRVARACAAGVMKSEDGALMLGKSGRFVQLLISRLRNGGPEAILHGALTLRDRVSGEGQIPSTAVEISGVTPLRYGYVRDRWTEIVNELGHSDLVLHDMRRTALDIFKRAGLRREECKRWLGHKTDSMFEWYSIDPDENEIIEQGEKIAASLRTRRKSAAAS
jgi:integrase